MRTVYLRLTENPELTLRSIAGHEKASLLIERKTRRPEASGAETWPITRAALNLRVVEDILRSIVAGKWCNRGVVAIIAFLEWHSNQLESRCRAPVPRTVIGNVHVGIVSIELAVDGRGVWHEGELRSSGLLIAGVVAEAAVGCLHKPVSNLEGLVGEVARLPDSEAGRISVPVVIRLGNVTHVVDLFTRVVVMDIL